MVRKLELVIEWRSMFEQLTMAWGWAITQLPNSIQVKRSNYCEIKWINHIETSQRKIGTNIWMEWGLLKRNLREHIENRIREEKWDEEEEEKEGENFQNKRIVFLWNFKWTKAKYIKNFCPFRNWMMIIIANGNEILCFHSLIKTKTK